MPQSTSFHFQISVKMLNFFAIRHLLVSLQYNQIYGLQNFILCRMIGTVKSLPVVMDSNFISKDTLGIVQQKFESHVKQTLRLVSSDESLIGTPIVNRPDFVPATDTECGFRDTGYSNDNFDSTISYQLQSLNKNVGDIRRKLEFIDAEREVCLILDHIYSLIFQKLVLKIERSMVHCGAYRRFFLIKIFLLLKKRMTSLTSFNRLQTRKIVR